MRIICFLILVFARLQTIHAQFATPVKESISSIVLNEQRDIEIILPEDYQSDTAHYDVWYTLDGEWTSRTFTSVASYLMGAGFMPPVIIVSVPNRYANGYEHGFNYRERDLTPTAIPYVDSSGGAGNFLAFLEKELLPFINKKYRTSSESGLFGASYGGLFTMYALLERPLLFRFYTMSDPAFEDDNHYVPRLAARRLPELKFTNTVLNIAGRSGLSYSSMARDVMDSILRTTAPKGLHWHSALYDEETHSSVTFKSNYDALKYAYLGYSSRKTRFNLTRGTVLKDRPVKALLNTDNADMRYTADGSEPLRFSTGVNDFLIISDPSQIRVKSFSPSGRYVRDIPIGLKAGDYTSPKKLLKKSAKGKAEPKLDSQSRMIAGLMKGVVNISQDGYYVLQLTPSKSTRMYFNDSLLVDFNVAIGHARETIILPLRKGDYAFRLEQPSKNPDDPPLEFGFYYSQDGQDEWWKSPFLLRN